MEPSSPVINGMEEEEVVYAKDQPEYIPLPTLRSNDDAVRVLSRWKLTDVERAAVAAGADIFLEVFTFGHPFLPVRLFAGAPDAQNVLDYFVKEYRR